MKQEFSPSRRVAYSVGTVLMLAGVAVTTEPAIAAVHELAPRAAHIPELVLNITDQLLHGVASGTFRLVGDFAESVPEALPDIH